jgi:hypothetical protein
MHWAKHIFLGSMLIFATSVAVAGPVVGVAVANQSSTAEVGSSSSDGTIYFYIPLTDTTETYGVDGGGLSSDTCSTWSGTCTGGTLEMLLFFDVVDAGNKTVTIDFKDLDSSGVNDPWFFVEALQIFDQDGNLIATIDSSSDLLAGSNSNSQSVQFDLVVDGAFYVQLVFDSDFDPNAPGGYFRNTYEALRATVDVPEPAAIAMFGFGLLLVGMRRRRALRQST